MSKVILKDLTQITIVVETSNENGLNVLFNSQEEVSECITKLTDENLKTLSFATDEGVIANTYYDKYLKNYTVDKTDDGKFLVIFNLNQYTKSELFLKDMLLKMDITENAIAELALIIGGK